MRVAYAKAFRQNARARHAEARTNLELVVARDPSPPREAYALLAEIAL